MYVERADEGGSTQACWCCFAAREVRATLNRLDVSWGTLKPSVGRVLQGPNGQQARRLSRPCGVCSTDADSELSPTSTASLADCSTIGAVSSDRHTVAKTTASATSAADNGVFRSPLHLTIKSFFIIINWNKLTFGDARIALGLII